MLVFSFDFPIEKQRTIARQAAQARKPLPDKIANAPELILGLELYLDAFFDLCSERQIGMGAMGPIPITKTLEYCNLSGFDEEQTEDLLFYISHMDSAWLKRSKEKADKANEKPKE